MKLRAVEPSDLDLLFDIENDVTLWSVSSARAPLSRVAIKQFIARSAQNDIYALRQQRFVIETGVDEFPSQAPVGFVDLVDFSPEHRRAEVGLIILPQYRGCGWGSRALRRLAEFSRDVLALRQLYAYTLCENRASVALFGSCGFEETALLHDWFFYAGNYHDALLFQKKLV